MTPMSTAISSDAPSPPDPSPATGFAAARFYDGERYEANDSVAHQLYRLLLGLRRDIEARMALHGLTDAQWRPLWLLKIGRASTALELAREMDVDAGAVSRLVARLRAKGLLTQVRSEADRRVVHLRLTPAGQATVAAVPHVLAALNNDLLGGFSTAEWAQLKAFLGRMTHNVTTRSGASDPTMMSANAPGSDAASGVGPRTAPDRTA